MPVKRFKDNLAQVIVSGDKEACRVSDGVSVKLETILMDVKSSYEGSDVCTLEIRDILLRCSEIDWGEVSPIIFGSLFQEIMQTDDRRQSGSHYTSEDDILKVVNSLFMDDLRDEFENGKGSVECLKRLLKRLSEIQIMDPACGCGNFLVIAYRELRLLELDILCELYTDLDGFRQGELNVCEISKVRLYHFHGIELFEWPVRIAELAMWLMDYQMNRRLSDVFGEYDASFSLDEKANIVCGNALSISWDVVLASSECSFVIGNPPFVGHHNQTKDQRSDQLEVLSGIKGCGVLDYVSNWFVKAAEYMDGTKIQSAFVSTNSIMQGEQVGILWDYLIEVYHVKINFAHRTFKWQSDVSGKAHVHVVIIGFGQEGRKLKKIYSYEDGVLVEEVGNISPYLIKGSDVVVRNRKIALCESPEMFYGNKPVDGGYLIMTDSEREKMISEDPEYEAYIRPYVGARDAIRGTQRWCLWLFGIDEVEWGKLKGISERIESVRKFRLSCKATKTRKFADCPERFGQVAQPETDYIMLPIHSSERRDYVPLSWYPSNVILSDACFSIINVESYHFGILTSRMHMVWMRLVCGRMGKSYRYSKDIVYNNFPWPDCVSTKNHSVVSERADFVLEVRNRYPLLTLADLYDPDKMPDDLLEAHKRLDDAVDCCYREDGFENDRERVEWLLGKYVELLKR